MKTIFKVRFHPLFYMLLILSVLTGQFGKILEFMMVILVHELGHITMANLFHWKIKRVLILPFGGMVEFEEKLNRPIYQELLIALAGPLTQILFSQFYLSKFHYPLLFFNLLPIYPLDGSKILFLLCNFLMGYYDSYFVLYGVSMTTIFLFLFFSRNVFYFLFFAYLLFQNIKALGQLEEIFLKFLWERYHSSFFFFRTMILPSQKWKKMRRDVYHFFLFEKELYEEPKGIMKVLKKRLKK